MCGEYETAVAAAKRAVRANPDFPLAYRWLAAALGQLGRTAEALKRKKRWRRLSRSRQRRSTCMSASACPGIGRKITPTCSRDWQGRMAGLRQPWSLPRPSSSIGVEASPADIARWLQAGATSFRVGGTSPPTRLSRSNHQYRGGGGIIPQLAHLPVSPISWGGQPGCVSFRAGLDTSIGGLPSSRAIAFIRMRMISKSSAACMLIFQPSV